MAEPRRAEREKAWAGRSESAAFAEAVTPHMAAMFRLAARLSPSRPPDDLVQDALLRAWRHRTSFDPQKGPFASWLLAIVANEARRKGRRLGLPIQLATPSSTSPVDDRLDMEAAVAKLPESQRQAIDCYYYVGLSVAETALVMNCAEGTVKSTLADARSNLRRTLEKEL